MEMELMEARQPLSDFKLSNGAENRSFLNQDNYNSNSLLSNQSQIEPYIRPTMVMNRPEKTDFYITSNPSNNLSAAEKLKNFASIESVNFQSEAARHIITEISDGPGMASNNASYLGNPSNQYRRNTPREKKRHYTAPNTLNTEAIQQYLAENSASKNVSDIFFSFFMFIRNRMCNQQYFILIFLRTGVLAMI